MTKRIQDEGPWPLRSNVHGNATSDLEQLCQSAATGQVSWDALFEALRLRIGAQSVALVHTGRDGRSSVSVACRQTQASWRKAIETNPEQLFSGHRVRVDVRAIDNAELSIFLQPEKIGTKIGNTPVITTQLKRSLEASIRQSAFALVDSWTGESNVCVTGVMSPTFEIAALPATFSSQSISDVLGDCLSLQYSQSRLRPSTDRMRTVLQYMMNQAKVGHRETIKLKSEVSPPEQGATSDTDVGFGIHNGDAPTSDISITIRLRPKKLDWFSKLAGPYLVQIERSSPNVPHGAALLGAFYGLTPAETEALKALSVSRDAREAARHLDVRYETFRWHLKNIFGKIGCSSQNDLLRAVAFYEVPDAIV